jgi:glycosyltransferase involved in cell wall biosynthesis
MSPHFLVFGPGLGPAFDAAATRGIGGAEMQLSIWANYFLRLGRVTIVMSGDQRPPAQFCALSAIAPAQSLGSAIARPFRLWQLLGKAQPDIVVCRALGTDLVALALWCKLHGKMLVYQWASDADLDGGLIRARLGVQGLLRRLVVRARRLAALQICQTETQFSRLTRAERTSALVVPNVIDPRVEWMKSRGRSVLWVGTIREGPKRPEKFLSLARALPHRKFVMVGELRGLEEVTKRVRREIESIQNLNYLGPLARTQIAAAYAEARVLVNVSDFEGFPNTFLEAAASGVPVVSLNVDPNQVLQESGMGTMLFGNEEKLISAIEAYFEDEFHASKVAQCARVAEMHDATRVLKPVLTRLLEDWNAGSGKR